MITPVDFYPNFSPTPAQWAQLKEAVYKGHGHRQFYMSMNGLLSAKSVKLATLTSGSEILAFLFYSDRAWNCGDSRFTGRSLGLITTLAEHQGKGFARKLVNAITDFSSEGDINFLYLQGIPNFYSRFGFHGFSPKRKFIFNPSVFAYKNTKVFPLEWKYHHRVKQVYQEYSRYIGGYVERSEGEWGDLFHSLSSTFLFYQPRVITDFDGSFVGYFCVSPTDPTQIRECAFLPTEENAFFACSAIANYVQELGASHMEIYSPVSSPLYGLSFNMINSDFICYLRPSSSNMVKWLFGPKLPASILESFIFQGDNL